MSPHRPQEDESESAYHERAARFQEEHASKARDKGLDHDADRADDRARRAHERADEARRLGN